LLSLSQRETKEKREGDCTRARFIFPSGRATLGETIMGILSLVGVHSRLFIAAFIAQRRARFALIPSRESSSRRVDVNRESERDDAGIAIPRIL